MKILLCDADLQRLKKMECWIREAEDHISQVMLFENGIDLIERVKKIPGDPSVLLVIHVNLKNDNGVEVARMVKDLIGNVAVIFLSEKDELFCELCAAEPVALLKTPLDREFFLDTLRCGKKKVIDEQKKILCVQKGSNVILIFFDEIYYVESKGRKVRVVYKDHVLDYYAKMDELEQDMSGCFVRCHKSFLVNMEKVRGLIDRKICLLNGDRIPVSRSRFGKTKEEIRRYFVM